MIDALISKYAFYILGTKPNMKRTIEIAQEAIEIDVNLEDLTKEQIYLRGFERGVAQGARRLAEHLASSISTRV